jgi:hypothetical protein
VTEKGLESEVLVGTPGALPPIPKDRIGSAGEEMAAEDRTVEIDEEAPTTDDEPAFRAEEMGWPAEEAEEIGWPAEEADEMAEDSIEVLRETDRTEEEEGIEELEEALGALPGLAGTFLIPETVPLAEDGWNVIPEEEVPVSM